MDASARVITALTESQQERTEIALEAGPPGAPRSWWLEDPTADRITVPFHGRTEHYLRVQRTDDTSDLPIFCWAYTTWPAE